MSKEHHHLLESISQGTELCIKGNVYRPIAKVIYVALSSPDKIYGKVFFDDHEVLVICPDDRYICFGKDLGNIGNDLPGKSTITYLDKTFQLVVNDYQIVVSIEFGDPIHIEGEVNYWDYESVDDPTRTISLGTIQRTGERADVMGDILSLKDLVLG